MGLRVQAAIAHWVQRVTGHSSQSPEAVLTADQNIDPRLVPKTPMSSTEIDANLLVELGKMGMKRGKLVASGTVPELRTWLRMPDAPLEQLFLHLTGEPATRDVAEVLSV